MEDMQPAQDPQLAPAVFQPGRDVERAGERAPGRRAVAAREHERDAERALELQLDRGAALGVGQFGKRTGAPGPAFKQMGQVLEDGSTGCSQANPDPEVPGYAEAPIQRTSDIAELKPQWPGSRSASSSCLPIASSSPRK